MSPGRSEPTPTEDLSEFDDELRQNPRFPRCSIALILEDPKLTPKRRQQLLDVLPADKAQAYPGTIVAKRVNRWELGTNLGANAVNRHRAGDCSCAKT